MRQIELEKVNQAYKCAKDLKMQMLENNAEKYAYYQGMAVAFKLIIDYMNEEHNELSLIFQNYETNNLKNSKGKI